MRKCEEQQVWETCLYAYVNKYWPTQKNAAMEFRFQAAFFTFSVFRENSYQ